MIATGAKLWLVALEAIMQDKGTLVLLFSRSRATIDHDWLIHPKAFDNVRTLKSLREALNAVSH